MNVTTCDTSCDVHHRLPQPYGYGTSLVSFASTPLPHLAGGALRAALLSSVTNTSAASKFHRDLAEFHLRRIDPTADGSFMGDDPLSLILAPYHLAKGGSDQLSTFINLLRSAAYARHLVKVPFLPPLPLLLLDVITRGQRTSAASSLSPTFLAAASVRDPDAMKLVRRSPPRKCTPRRASPCDATRRLPTPD